MGIKKDANDARIPDPVVAWRVALIAPTGFDHPLLRDTLARRLWPLLARRSRQGPLDLMTAFGEPVSRAAGPLAADKKWFRTGLGSAAESSFHPGRRTWVALLSHADAAVLVFAGDRPPDELVRLADLAVWLRVPIRWLRVG